MSEDDADLRRRYRAAFANLPWMQREIFRMHRLEGLAYREIAWLLNVSERCVERQMSRAITKIAKQMDGQKLSWRERLF